MPGMEQDPGSEAWVRIVQLFKSAEKRRRFVEIADSLVLTPGMVGGLLCLVPDEGKPMRAMVEEWHCDPSWVTVVIDDLEERGLAGRQVDTVDRRAKTVHLTDLGPRCGSSPWSCSRCPRPASPPSPGPSSAPCATCSARPRPTSHRFAEGGSAAA